MSSQDVFQIITGPDDVPEKNCPYVIIRDEVSIRYIKSGETEYTVEILSLWGCYSFVGIQYELAEARKRVGVPIEITNIDTSISWVTLEGKEVHSNDAAFRGKSLREYRSIKRRGISERRYTIYVKYREPNEKKDIFDWDRLYSEDSLNDIIHKIYKKYEGKHDVRIVDIDVEPIAVQTF